MPTDPDNPPVTSLQDWCQVHSLKEFFELIEEEQMENIDIKNEVMLTPEQVAALQAGQEVAVNVTVDLTEPTATPAV